MREWITGIAPFYGILMLILLLGSEMLLALMILQRRLRYLPAALPLLAVSYLGVQVMASFADGDLQPGTLAGLAWLTSLPRPLAVALLAGLPVVMLVLMSLLFRILEKYEATRITPMSVKEAVDSLPAGLCAYPEGGMVLLSNRTMELLCQDITGETLYNGERFRQRLLSQKHIKTPEADATVVILEDGRAWALTESQAEYQGLPVHILAAAEVTELYEKNRSLQALQEELGALNRRLTAYYEEISALTVQREIMEARVRLHDEMGTILLVMGRYIREGGDEAARREIEAHLRRNISFLRAGNERKRQDEYALMLETAERLQVHIRVTGDLPETQPQKHILATAMHECFTNTLRHAHGDELRLNLTERGDRILAVFTGNGDQPTEPIREKGGLTSLRKLTEEAGGTMTVEILPVFTITLDLPKEVPHGL